MPHIDAGHATLPDDFGALTEQVRLTLDALERAERGCAAADKTATAAERAARRWRRAANRPRNAAAAMLIAATVVATMLAFGRLPNQEPIAPRGIVAFDAPTTNAPDRVQTVAGIAKSARDQFSHGQIDNAVNTALSGLELDPNDPALQALLADIMQDAERRSSTP